MAGIDYEVILPNGHVGYFMRRWATKWHALADQIRVELEIDEGGDVDVGYRLSTDTKNTPLRVLNDASFSHMIQRVQQYYSEQIAKYRRAKEKLGGRRATADEVGGKAKRGKAKGKMKVKAKAKVKAKTKGPGKVGGWDTTPRIKRITVIIENLKEKKGESSKVST